MKFSVNFEGFITVEAKSRDEAQEVFWNWVGDIQDKTHYDNCGVILKTPFFEFDGTEEEEE